MFEPLKGFRDYYPKEWLEIQENLFNKARKIANSFGFEEIEMPLIERTDFLIKKSGEEIKEQIFNILPKKTIILINKLKNLISKEDRSTHRIVVINITKMKKYKDEKTIRLLDEKEKKLKEKNLLFRFEEINESYLKNNEEFLLNFGDEIYLISLDGNNDLEGYDFLFKVNFKPLILIDDLSLNPEMSLRFDLTMPAIRMALKKYKELTKPIKWFYIAKNYRYEEPQKGRDREFFQIGVEFFGEKDYIADLEVLNFGISFLNEIGLKNKFKVKINDRRIIDYLLKDEENKNEIIKLFDKYRKISKEEFINNLKSLTQNWEFLFNIIKNPIKLSEINKILEVIKDEKLKNEIKREIKFLRILENKALIEFDLSIVRGLDYYTSLVFEFYDINEEYRALAGGGRYDNLAESLGFKEKVYATGMALGPSVLEVYMKEKNLWKNLKIKKDFIIIPISENELVYAYNIADNLRKKGFKVEFAYKKGISKNLSYANSKNINYAIIIGENELKDNKLLVKNLITGKEKLLDVELFLKKIEIGKIDNELI